MEVKDWQLKALTPIWTGDAGGNGDRLIPTGIMGALRWWFEVLVRGLGGRACDPTTEVRCPDKNVQQADKPGHHCVVCELFGCTGWARKFRLMVLDEHDQVIQNQIQADQTFILRFVPLRPIREEEWCLLDATLRLIADYGAMGGKTVFKPSDESNRQNQLHHQDFGIVAVDRRPEGIDCNQQLASTFVHGSRNRRNFQDNSFSWASLQHFWCVKGRYLARQDSQRSSFNRVIGRDMRKNRSQQLFQNTNINRWLAGRQQESKKVFSFKHPEVARRTFGFVKPRLVNFQEIESRLGQVWSEFEAEHEFQQGEQIIEKLFQMKEGI
ncbi:MAG: type III-B CRISPR module RAMP protein Cmr1 [Bacteroidetes bacterium]|nr:MAG: type III-B CRISPR module RAMP protein Cmr1 [Bacteroidota bacterium]